MLGLLGKSVVQEEALDPLAGFPANNVEIYGVRFRTIYLQR